MKNLKIIKDTNTNGFTLNQTITMTIAGDVRHEDERGEYWSLETIWKHDTIIPPTDDWSERRGYFDRAQREAEEQLAILSA